MAQDAPQLARAKEILRGKDVDFKSLVELAEALKDNNDFSNARRLFARARRHPDLVKWPAYGLKVPQREALCTYKDQDLPEGVRFTRALEILKEADDPHISVNQETLGLSGAIYKRLWDVEGQKAHLARSLGYYRRGYDLGVEKDQGYTAINAAFVLDLLASDDYREATQAGVESPEAAAWQAEARRIRLDLIARLPPLLTRPDTEWLGTQWWFVVTLAEAHFGLGEYDSAGEWLQRAARLPQVARWEFETTVQQLAALARLRAILAKASTGPEPQGATERDAWEQGFAEEEARAWNALYGFLGDKAPGVERAFVGKVGLALSGGGFRASLFHIGVLAHLAERDALRKVEVLSCVSGGSIVGAHFYLEVRELLRIKRDTEITPQDYIDIIQRLARDFLAGVQTNLRSRVLSEFWTNLKAMFWPNYTRTQRMGELYESQLFSRVNDAQGSGKRWLNELFVRPLGESETGFAPKYDNWRRRAKVPVLVLNATTLNTGHNWQFTASWMGEPPAGIDSEIDGNYQLRRMYYSEAPTRYQRIRLGHAVAASACVPGLFEPLMMKGLYPDKTVRLVDGGVYDNQGVASLLEQDCRVLLVSDASGQMAALDEPSAGILGVPLRAFSVSMARVRQAEYHELDARLRSSLLRGLMFVHLKKDLDVEPINWVDCQDRYDASDDARPIVRRGPLTGYGFRKDVQARLAAIRTDLDSFSEVEAYALMASGYRMAEHEFGRCIDGFPPPPPQRPAWRFLDIEPLLQPGPGFVAVLKRLTLARQAAFKVWRLSKPLTAVGFVLLGGLLGVLIWAWRHWGATSILTVGAVGWTLIGIVATLLIGPLLIRMVRFRKTLGQIGLVTAATLLVVIVFKIHLATFDKLFLRLGRLSAVQRKGSG